MKKEYVEMIKEWSFKNGAEYRIFHDKATIYFEDEAWIIQQVREDLYEVRHSNNMRKLSTHRQRMVDEREGMTAMEYILTKVIQTHDPYKTKKDRYTEKMEMLFEAIQETGTGEKRENALSY